MWVVLFSLQLAAVELFVRGPRFYASHPRALAHLVASAALLHLAVAASRRRPARVAIALLVGVLLVAQLAFFRYYHAPIDDQVALAARRSWDDVRPMVLGVLPALWIAVLAIAAVEYVWLSRLRRPRVRPRLAALALVAGVLLGGSLRHATTELRLAHAAGALVFARDPSREGDRHDLATMTSRRARVPSVLFVLSESIRASDYCGEPGAPCTVAPETHALLPARIPLLEMRAVSSYTSISLSVLLTGLPQTGSRDRVLAAPDLFDYVRATRAGDAPVGVHYWSAHSGTVFERSGVEREVDSFVSADTMMGHPIDDVEDAIAAGLDRRLAEECRVRFPKLQPPYLTMVHFSGTHAPYFFDDSSAPYTPFQRHVTWSGLEALHRAYLNAIVEQDRSVAACVRAFLEAQRGGPWVIFFTSDHGEAFGEHSAIHHGQNLYDEQIHVPAFVAYGAGALRSDEERALSQSKAAFVTHLDVVPTLLDVLGVLEDFTLGAARRKMPGSSLLRPLPLPPPPLPVTNCSEMWTCPLNAWGIFDGDRKLTAQPWDPGWRCFALQGGEREQELSQCADLVRASRGVFPKRPNGDAND